MRLFLLLFLENVTDCYRMLFLADNILSIYNKLFLLAFLGFVIDVIDVIGPIAFG